MLESKIKERFKTDEKSVLMTDNENLEQEAKAALSFIERWGMVAAADGGEDSAGRAKLRLMTPDELVERAFAIAHIAFDKARSRELVHRTPSLSELEDDDAS